MRNSSTGFKIFIVMTVGFVASVFATVDPTGFKDVFVSSSLKVGGSGAIDSKSALEVSSTTKTFLPPRMTSTQKNAISGPGAGSLVYDSTFTDLWLYEGSAWVDISVPPTAFGTLGKFLQSSGGIAPNGWATPGPTTGGTGFTTYALGDTLYSDATNSLAKLAGNTTATKKFLNQTGNGSVSAAPVWSAMP